MEKQEYSLMFKFEVQYWWYVGLHQLIKHYIKKFSHNNTKKNILDAGCGTGRMLQLLSDYENIEGFDLSEEAIEFAKKRELKNLRVKDITAWKPVSNNYDFVISSDVICSTGINNENEILDNFYKSLKKGGKLFLNLPAFEILRRNHDIAVHVRKRYKRKEFIKDLKKAGFKIKVATYRLPLLYFVILMQKIFEKKSSIENAKSDLKEIPKLINSLLIKYNQIENYFIKSGFRFPIGSSLFIVAEKN